MIKTIRELIDLLEEEIKKNPEVANFGPRVKSEFGDFAPITGFHGEAEKKIFSIHSEAIWDEFKTKGFIGPDWEKYNTIKRILEARERVAKRKEAVRIAKLLLDDAAWEPGDDECEDYCEDECSEPTTESEGKANEN